MEIKQAIDSLMSQLTPNNTLENQAYLKALSCFKSHISNEQLNVIKNRIQEGSNIDPERYTKLSALFFDCKSCQDLLNEELNLDLIKEQLQLQNHLSVDDGLYDLELKNALKNIKTYEDLKDAETIKSLDRFYSYTKKSYVKRSFSNGQFVGCQKDKEWLMAIITYNKLIGNNWIYYVHFCNLDNSHDKLAESYQLQRFNPNKHRMYMSKDYAEGRFCNKDYAVYNDRIVQINHIMKDICRIKYSDCTTKYIFLKDLEVFDPIKWQS